MREGAGRSARSRTAGAETAAERDGYRPIEDYAIIGDCHTAALISRDGSIDWYCPARFDAPAVFCRILDDRKGGYLQLAPTASFRAERRYRGETNVLETTFETESGVARLTDLMPIHHRQRSYRGYDVGSSHRLLRLVECVRGEVEIELAFKPTFRYARGRTRLRVADGGGAIAQAGGEYLALACGEMTLECDAAGVCRGRLRLRKGQRRWVTLTYAQDPDRAREALAPVSGSEQLHRTVRYWHRWARRGSYRGPYRSHVVRSTLVLKLLTYEASGAIVAAPTTSLPEQVGGVRNWDYRYTWLRDASLMLYALMTIGHDDEANDFFAWLSQASGASASALQIMYGIDGRRRLPERTLGHLEGYRGSRPVRVGNAAADQRQLDIFGEVLRAAYVFYHADEATGATAPAPPTAAVWRLLRRLVEQAARRWKEPDNGIWEVRGGPRQFLYSKLMCWAALDRGVRLAEERHLSAPLDEWRRTRDAIHDWILERGYNQERQVFTQAEGSTALDASALAIPRVGFLPATDPRVRSTVQRIQQELTRDGLVYRHRTDDGLPGGEATFVLGSFWLVDALALGGQIEAAHDLFERVVGYANDVGLLAEEIDPSTHCLLGNFPQGFSHMTLITSAVNLAKAAKHGPEERSQNEAERAGPARRAAAEEHSRRKT